MYKSKSFLAIIPARGGSKTLPRKNIKNLGGKPLINWSIDSALKSNHIDRTIVSSDDNEIINIAKKAGAEIPFSRPDYLGTDVSTTEDVLIHAIDFFKGQDINYDYIVLLQPTSPLRKEGDIDLAIEKAVKTKADMVVSVKETSSNPYYVLFEENEDGFLKKSKESNFTRRQDCPIVYEYNGSIYVIKVSALLKSRSRTFAKTVKFVMDDLHSIDIDNQLDFDFTEFVLNKYL